MSLLVELALAAVAAAGAAMATGLWRRAPGVEEKFAAKLARIQDHTMSLQEIELSKPFRERFINPIRDRILTLVMSRTPASRQTPTCRPSSLERVAREQVKGRSQVGGVADLAFDVAGVPFGVHPGVGAARQHPFEGAAPYQLESRAE